MFSEDSMISGTPDITNVQQTFNSPRDPEVLEDGGVTNVPGSWMKSGRNLKVLEKKKSKKIEETTTAGAVATVAQPMGKVNRRGSIFAGIKTSKKYANSSKAGIYEDEISEENLLAKQRQEELFKKSRDRDIGKRKSITDILLKKQIQDSSMNEEEDNDFWYHGPHAVAQELHRIHNKPTITVEDVHNLWETNPPKAHCLVNGRPYMEEPDVGRILSAHKELMENDELENREAMVAELIHKTHPEFFTRYGDEYVMHHIQRVVSTQPSSKSPLSLSAIVLGLIKNEN
jgi:hypothetical protein